MTTNNITRGGNYFIENNSQHTFINKHGSFRVGPIMCKETNVSKKWPLSKSLFPFVWRVSIKDKIGATLSRGDK